MDDQALQGLRNSCTPVERRLTEQYFERLKSSPDGWKLCATDLTQRIHSDDSVRFFCLQVMEHHIRTRHAACSDEDILTLRKVLLTWMQPQQGDGMLDKVFVRKKMAQIMALTFVQDYPVKWPQFFTDLLSIVKECDHMSAVDMYLRALLAIDSEVVDRDIVHTYEENARGALIKDHMRDHCVPQLVESWFTILRVFEHSNTEVACLAMNVVGAYVSWIDITLIANDKFIGLLLRYLSIVNLRESAAECLHDIINKGMEPLAKTQLIQSLVKLLEDTGIISTEIFQGETDDVEFQAKLSKLMNGVGTSLVVSYNKFIKLGDQENAYLALEIMESKLPYMFRYLLDEDDEVSENIINFAVSYVGVLKHRANLSDEDRQNLKTLLDVIVTKLKYDESYNFVTQGEEEAMFQEYRNRLRVLLDNIAQMVPGLAVHVCQSLVSSTLANLPSEPYMNVEVMLRLFFLLGESISEKQFGSAAKPESPFHSMMAMGGDETLTRSSPALREDRQIVGSSLSYHSHNAVLLQYYETIVRYEKFFSSATEFIPPVLESLLDARGLKHTSPAVRSRLCYLFLRFIKSIRNHLGPLSQQILTSLQDLLFALPGTAKFTGYITGNDMTFLYEATGFLIVHSSQPPDVKRPMIAVVLAPLLENFQLLLPELTRASTVTQQEEIAQALYFMISFASRTSKVFPNHLSTTQSGCLEPYVEALPVLLRGLECSVQRDQLQSGVRQYLHRMVICLGDELLKYVPLAVSLLLKDCQAHDLQEFIPLINQLITKYKVQIVPILQEIFMPIVASIGACLNQPYDQDDNEEKRERQGFQKSFYMFIHSIASNGVQEVMVSQDLQHLEVILQSVVDGAVNFPDPTTQKMCFFTLKKLIEAWGGDGILPGFTEYLYREILPACFIAPLKASFDLNDGHTYLTLGEVTGVLKALINRRGNECVLYLQTTYLPSLQFPPELIQEFMVKIQESDVKSLKPYLKALFIKLRTFS